MGERLHQCNSCYIELIKQINLEIISNNITYVKCEGYINVNNKNYQQLQIGKIYSRHSKHIIIF